MSIKEFAQKNSQVFFYATIVLAIVCVILGFSVCSNKGPRNTRDRFDQNRMMQRGSFNGQFNPQNRAVNSVLPDDTNTPAPSTSDTTVTPTVNQ